MPWAEYTVASLDLTEESPIPGSRPYRQGRLSLNGENIFVRFIRDETPWQGGTLYESANDARGVLSSPAYTAPPTAGEIEQERVAVVDYKEQQLLQLAAHKLKGRASGVPMEDTSLAAIKAACLEVQAGGNKAGNSIVDNLVRLYGANVTNTVKKVLQTISVLEQRAAQVHALVLAGRRAKDRDEDIQPFIDELRAL